MNLARQGDKLDVSDNHHPNSSSLYDISKPHLYSTISAVLKLSREVSIRTHTEFEHPNKHSWITIE